jgi:hypothetical protein
MTVTRRNFHCIISVMVIAFVIITANTTVSVAFAESGNTVFV